MEDDDGLKTPVKVPVARNEIKKLIKERVDATKALSKQMYEHEASLRNQPKNKRPDKGGDAAFDAFMSTMEPEQEETTSLSLQRSLHMVNTLLSLSPSATFTLSCLSPLMPQQTNYSSDTSEVLLAFFIKTVLRVMGQLDDGQRREVLARALEISCDDEQLMNVCEAAGIEEFGSLAVMLCSMHNSAALEPIFAKVIETHSGIASVFCLLA